MTGPVKVPAAPPLRWNAEVHYDTGEGSGLIESHAGVLIDMASVDVIAVHLAAGHLRLAPDVFTFCPDRIELGGRLLRQDGDEWEETDTQVIVRARPAAAPADKVARHTGALPPQVYSQLDYALATPLLSDALETVAPEVREAAYANPGSITSTPFDDDGFAIYDYDGTPLAAIHWTALLPRKQAA